MSNQNVPPPQKTSFGKAPEGYIAGLGRGAIGFITRSDIGPAKLGGESAFTGVNDDGGDYSETKFDSWSGYEGSLFAGSGPMDEEDREADEVFSMIDRKMDERRAKRREARFV